MEARDLLDLNSQMVASHSAEGSPRAVGIIGWTWGAFRCKVFCVANKIEVVMLHFY